MHDIVDLESRGVPGVFVATVEFTDGAVAQARALGAEAAGVYVAHPIQDRSDAELVELAEGALEALIAALTGRGD